MKSCFFIGHRESSEEVFLALTDVVEHHITNLGVTEFFVGNYGGFDHMVAKALAAAKKRHPHIILLMVIAYHPAERSVQLPDGFDGTFYPPDMEFTPRRFAIARANRYMVNHADYLIAYVWHPASNARNLVEYARKKGKEGRITVTNLAEP